MAAVCVGRGETHTARHCMPLKYAWARLVHPLSDAKIQKDVETSSHGLSSRRAGFTVALYNPLAWQRTHHVRVPIAGGGRWAVTGASSPSFFPCFRLSSLLSFFLSFFIDASGSGQVRHLLTINKQNSCMDRKQRIVRSLITRPASALATRP